MNFTPVTGLLFGVCALLWLVLIGWIGWRWLGRYWHWPEPLIVVVQGVLAAQICWLFGLMALNEYLPTSISPWLDILGIILFWLALSPWFIFPNLLPLFQVAVMLRFPFPDMINAAFGYGLVYAAVYRILSYRLRRLDQLSSPRPKAD